MNLEDKIYFHWIIIRLLPMDIIHEKLGTQRPAQSMSNISRYLQGKDSIATILSASALALLLIQFASKNILNLETE